MGVNIDARCQIPDARCYIPDADAIKYWSGIVGFSKRTI